MLHIIGANSALFLCKGWELLVIDCIISQLCLMAVKLWKCAGDRLLLQILNELSGCPSPLRISTPVLPGAVSSLSSISERVTTVLCNFIYGREYAV